MPTAPTEFPRVTDMIAFANVRPTRFCYVWETGLPCMLVRLFGQISSTPPLFSETSAGYSGIELSALLSLLDGCSVAVTEDSPSDASAPGLSSSVLRDTLAKGLGRFHKPRLRSPGPRFASSLSLNSAVCDHRGMVYASHSFVFPAFAADLISGRMNRKARPQRSSPSAVYACTARLSKAAGAMSVSRRSSTLCQYLAIASTLFAAGNLDVRYEASCVRVARDVVSV